MKVKSFLASKATTIEDLAKDLREIEAKLESNAMMNIPVVVVNKTGLEELKAYLESLSVSFKEDIAVKADDFIPSQVGIIYGRSIFLEEESNITVRILTVTPSIILSEWVEGK